MSNPQQPTTDNRQRTTHFTSGEIMIDIETLAVPEKLPVGYLPEVTQIGAVKFTSDGIVDELKSVFPKEGNGLCCASTVTFWLKQILMHGHGEVNVPRWVYERMETESVDTMSDMKYCLQKLTRFIGSDRATIWSKGKFDLDILMGHYGANQLTCPWKYWQHRDLRTMMKECGINPGYEGVEHDAHADAVAQVGYLLECRKQFNVRRAS